MAPKKANPIDKIAAQLAGGKPIAVSTRADGTLVVLDPRGRKLTFTPEEVARATDPIIRQEGGNEEAQ